MSGTIIFFRCIPVHRLLGSSTASCRGILLGNDITFHRTCLLGGSIAFRRSTVFHGLLFLFFFRLAFFYFGSTCQRLLFRARIIHGRIFRRTYRFFFLWSKIHTALIKINGTYGQRIGMGFLIKFFANSQKLFRIQIIMLIGINRGQRKNIFYITVILHFLPVTIDKSIMYIFKIGNRIGSRRIRIFTLYFRIIFSHNARAFKSQDFCHLLRSFSRFIQYFGKILTVKIHHFLIDIFTDRRILRIFLIIQIVNRNSGPIVDKTVFIPLKMKLLLYDIGT